MTAATAVRAEELAVPAADVPAPVAYLVSRFPRLTETFVLREIIELERRGQPVIVFPLLSVRQPIHHGETEFVARHVHYTPYLSREVFTANLHYFSCSPVKYLRALSRVLLGNRSSLHLLIRGLILFPKTVLIARTIASSDARHVHAHFATHPALAALIISELTGIGYSFTAHAHDIFLRTTMLREKIERSRFVVAISEYNKHYMLHLCPEAKTKMHVVRCGVEPERYAGRPPQSTLNKEGTPRIVCVASLEPYKGIQYLIRACALLQRSLPKFTCEIIGDGRERRRLLLLIRKLRLRQCVHLLGPRRQDEVTELLKQADIFVLPSVVARNGQMEGIPVALMEAMASGLPVVASRLSGIPELVDHGVNGLLVPPGDETALAAALERLSLSEGLRERFGVSGRQKVAGVFHLGTNVAQLESLFHTAVTPSKLQRSDSEFLPQDLLEEIRLRLLPGSADRGTNRTPIVLEPLQPDSDGHDSLVYRVHAVGFNGKLILKQHRPRLESMPAEQCSHREHAALEYLASVLPRYSKRFRVPEVMAFFPHRHALLMRECPGESFAGRLRWAGLRAGIGTERLLEGASACGEWLGIFHEATRMRDMGGAALSGRIADMVQTDLNACARHGLETSIVSRVSDFFTRACSSALESDRELSGHHGDFGPQNVFISSEQVTVIDFEGFRMGFPAEDLGDFLVLLSLLPGYHACAGLRRRLRQAFLDGYKRHHPLETETLGFFELMALVKRMAHNPYMNQANARRFAWKRVRLLRSYHRYFEFLLP